MVSGPDGFAWTSYLRNYSADCSSGWATVVYYEIVSLCKKRTVYLEDLVDFIDEDACQTNDHREIIFVGEITHVVPGP